jgi:transposase
VSTDEYRRDVRLCAWGYDYKSVTRGRGESAWDEDGDSVGEVQGHTREELWSLLRRGLRPHRGIAQETRPLYLGVFAGVANARTRGKALLHALSAVRGSSDPGIHYEPRE